ncbi:28S ribosomal protein S35, mitochondrial [Bulinus truncatus]|nr:28S ribosomal protein S35, mitochondrial [Bulinus truncatus]
MATFKCILLSDIQRPLNIPKVPLLFRELHTTLIYRQNEKKKDALSTESEEEFRVYEIEGLRQLTGEKRRKRILNQPLPPRSKAMPVNQNWTDVWPSASTFKWATVPFPVRQGKIDSTSENDGIIPSKYGNLELMKPPNFLHLTPAHIKKHCAVLKKFCTQWPDALDTDAKCRRFFPLETKTSDYVFSAPSVKDERARFASIKFYLSDLKFDYHARDKFIRLVGDRYNKKTDEVTFETGRCPLKSQNIEFLKFVFTVAFFESWKHEEWEKLKELSDMEKYFWNLNEARKNCLTLLKNIKIIDNNEAPDSKATRLDYLPEDVTDDEVLCSLPQIQKYKASVEDLFNEGENFDTIHKYKESVKSLLNIKCSVVL